MFWLIDNLIVVTIAAMATVLMAILLVLVRVRRDVGVLAGRFESRIGKAGAESTGITGGPSARRRSARRPRWKLTGWSALDQTERARLTFTVDAMLLVQMFQYLRHPHVETFAYIGGFESEPGRIVLTHLLPVGHARQSAVGAQADANSTLDVLGELDEFGLAVAAHVHTHPGRGPGAITPSETDRRLIKGLADGGYRALGLVFSQDGFFRAYMDESQPFALEIQGKHVAEISTNVWCIETTVAERPLSIGVPAVPGRSERAAGSITRF